jgi:hypothetical protein
LKQFLRILPKFPLSWISTHRWIYYIYSRCGYMLICLTLGCISGLNPSKWKVCLGITVWITGPQIKVRADEGGEFWQNTTNYQIWQINDDLELNISNMTWYFQNLWFCRLPKYFNFLYGRSPKNNVSHINIICLLQLNCHWKG